MPMYSIVVYVPITHGDDIRNALARAGAARSDTYDSCSFTTLGKGRFRPLPGANPTIGTIGRLEVVDEERIETMVEEAQLQAVVQEVVQVHPYEEPAISIFPMLNYKDYLFPKPDRSTSNSIVQGLPRTDSSTTVVGHSADGNASFKSTCDK